MHCRISIGLIAPSLSQIWTSLKSESEKENTYGPNFYSHSGQWDGNWDGRSAKTLVQPKPNNYMDQEEYVNSVEKKRSKANRNIILIRHGQYFDTAKTDDERRLTELGREQAQATGRRLMELRQSGMMPFSRVVCSTLKRAIETTELISKELSDEKHLPMPQTFDPLLCEGAPCAPDPKIGYWHPESRYLEDGSRIEAAFRRYFHRARPEQEKDSFEIITCHANVIRYFVCRALQFPPQGWLRMSLAHASITWIIVRYDGRVILRCFGDVGHMPPGLITTR